nr:hypothetical protein [Tanacetum cinerariifolium]
DDDDEEGSLEDDEDDDMDIKADEEEEEEEHPAPADSIVVALPAADHALFAKETELGIALGLGYEVGESSSAAARPAGGLKVDYGFFAIMDRESKHASDLARGEVMSLRTTVLGQTTEIRDLQVANRRRQIVTSEMLRADHRRFAEIRGLRTADRTRQQQVTALQGQVITLQVTVLQGQQGPAGGPTQPELPEEAGSSS